MGERTQDSASSEPLDDLFEPALGVDQDLAALTPQKGGVEKVARRQHDRQPPVLLHRDLQSSNVMVVRGRAVLIDFQGMRLGPAAYDLGSLLCDPYVSLGETMQRRLLALYAEYTAEDADALWPVFCHAAVQRLVQALGAYGRLSSRPDTAGFRRHIRPALSLLARVLTHLDKSPYLRDLVHEMETRL